MANNRTAQHPLLNMRLRIASWLLRWHPLVYVPHAVAQAPETSYWLSCTRAGRTGTSCH
jgi:hypothetical protein